MNSIKRGYLIAVMLVVSVLTAIPCTNFLFTKGSTTDGSVMITYSADSHVLFGELYFWKEEKHAKGDSLLIYEWDSGRLLGKIKQVPYTFRVVGNMNEHQLSIGETTYGGREELVDTTARLDYGSIIYVTLQRAKTAREAVQTIGKLVEDYGYCSEGESFSIADPNEAWIMEIIGKGSGRKGAVWVARKIPDGYVCGHANQARITTFPLNDPENCLYTPDVISFAREKGYFSGNDSEFSFSDTYAPVNFEGARFCEARVYSMFSKINSQMLQYEDYAMGKNLHNRMPLWIKPDKKISLHDVMGLMRDYYQGTPMDMTKDIGAGPYECIVRWRPLTWKVDGKTYFNERSTSTQQTGFSFVAQSRNWLPDPLGGIIWFGVDDTYSTVYTPMYCGITQVPPAYAVGNGSMMEFSETSAFWIFNQVSNFAYTRYNAIIPFIQEKQSALELSYIKQVQKTDSIAKTLKKQEDLLIYITDFSVNAGQNTFSSWKQLYSFLFTRFMDGNIKTKQELPPNYKYVSPKVEQPGYGDDWYRKIVFDTEDKFLAPEGEGH